MELHNILKEFQGGIKDVAKICGIAPINVRRILKDRAWTNKDVEEAAIKYIRGKIEKIHLELDRK